VTGEPGEIADADEGFVDAAGLGSGRKDDAEFGEAGFGGHGEIRDGTSRGETIYTASPTRVKASLGGCA
jgi:hypothetical protein